MRPFLSLLLSFSLLHSQTVVVPIPGERKAGNGGGGNDLGVVIGVLVGAGIFFLITKTLLSKPASKIRTLPFVPFQFIVVYRGELPPEVKVMETVEFENLRFSLIEWREEEEKLKNILRGKVLFLQPNYVYETFGEGTLKPSITKTSNDVVAVLDTGADRRLLKDVLLEVKNMRPDPYRPEPHGTAVVYVAHIPRKAKVILYRVCSGRRCDTWSVTKALIDVIRRNIKVVNMSFGTEATDRVVELLLKIAYKRGIKITAPVGNKPSPRLPFPARLPEVISVAGHPCFPAKVCLMADVREPYEFETPLGKVKGTSFSSAYHAGKILNLFPKVEH